jgi:hypothetical protein
MLASQLRLPSTESEWITAGVGFNNTWVPLYVLYNYVNSEKADYGRYSSAAKGGVDPRLFWVMMEIPNLIGAFIVLNSTLRDVEDCWSNPGFWVALLFVFHYVLRTLVFALLMRGGTRNPLSFLLVGGTFTCINGYAQVRYHISYAQYPEEGYFESPQFVLGTILFFAGMLANHHSDSILRNLRKDKNDKRHYIPRGGLFEYVSGANFLAECIEWMGYGLAAGTFVGWSFFWSTLVNTGARALNHHEDYKLKFKDEYPKDRKAFIPFVL